MRVCVSTEQRFERTPDGEVWVSAGPAYSFWRRYLDVFEEVRVIARICDVAEPKPAAMRASGKHVSFWRIPYYLGPWQYALRLPAIRSAIRRGVELSDALILRVPSPMTAFYKPLLGNGRPFGLEVVGDPHDVFAPGVVDHVLRPALRWWSAASLRRQCRKASAVAFVTRTTLQKRYPARGGAVTTHYSSIELPDEAFAASPRHYPGGQTEFRIVSVGSLEQRYKGIDVLVDAVALCAREGLRLRLDVVGDGRYRAELEHQAGALGLADAITFVGTLKGGAPVRAALDRADLFVLPSRTEGLPRAMIEAMARALPCIGSEVGGIPDLLPPDAMVPKDDPAALARKIREALASPERMKRMSADNLIRAREYDDRTLRTRRREFFQYVHDATESWIRVRAPHTFRQLQLRPNESCTD